MGLVLSGATILTVDAGDRVLAASDLRIEGHAIAAIGAGGSLTRPGDTVIDCSHALVMPGLVNVHTHAATALFRGLADDLPSQFWSGRYRVPGQERFTPEDYLQSLEAACAEYLLNGVTCIADRLSEMDRLAPVIAGSGLRAVLGSTVSDDRAPADWPATERLIEKVGTDPTARIFAGIAPHALDSCSDALLAECARRAEALGCRVFVHVAQCAAEVEAVRRRGHRGALDCLLRAGLVGPRLVAAHCIFLDEAEIDEWPRHGMSIAHCPASNLKIEARTLPIHRLIGRVPIGLGTDWTASNNANDLLSEARLAALVGKMLAGDPRALSVREMIRMLTIEGARVLGIDHLVGSIEPGKRADVIVLDLDRLEMSPAHYPASNVIYAASPRAVRDVIVDGEMLVRHGRLTRADEAVLARRHRALTERLGTIGGTSQPNGRNGA